MKIKSAVFNVSAPDLASCPKSALPEFAFIGRSNVGKSSLINLLSEKSGLAKVSDMPGKTKLINFYTMNDSWSLVDLPGYGYANVGKKDRAEFNRAVSDYLSKRRNIFSVFVLIDSRLPPQPIDLDFIEWLGSASVPFVLVFTKTDKPSATELRQNIDTFKKALSATWEELPEIFMTSATTKEGRTDVLNFVHKTLVAHNRS